MGLDPDLHAVVLGESLLNDAISIVLFEALFSFGTSGYVASGSQGGMAELGVLGENPDLAAAVKNQGTIGAAEVAFSELAVTTLVAFLGVFLASLIIGGMVGACSAMLHKHISITGDWDEGWVIDSGFGAAVPLPGLHHRGERELERHCCCALLRDGHGAIHAAELG